MRENAGDSGAKPVVERHRPAAADSRRAKADGREAWSVPAVSLGAPRGEERGPEEGDERDEHAEAGRGVVGGAVAVVGSATVVGGGLDGERAGRFVVRRG